MLEGKLTLLLQLTRYVAQNLLGCTAVFLTEYLPTFQRYVAASIIRLMSDASIIEKLRTANISERSLSEGIFLPFHLSQT
jgi:hypothetical protein